MARKIAVEITGDASSLERSFGRASRSAQGFEKNISRSSRGAIAGSGAFHGLGRSVAFASSAFIGAAGFTELLRNSIDAATQGAATQRQLAAQFKATGVALGPYRKAIEDTSNKLSALSGFTRDELEQSFLFAFRGTRNVTQSLKIEAAAADVARARHIGLQQATLAVTKGVTQNATALKRLGIAIPANIKGYQVLAYVQKRFAGQARAGATAQERLAASIHNLEETAGTVLLPTLNKVANAVSRWAAKSENQKRIQGDVTLAMQDTAAAVTILGNAYRVATKFAHGYMTVAKDLGKSTQPLGEIFKVLFLPGYGLKSLADALSGKQAGGPAKPPPGLAGPVGSPGGGGGLVPGLTGPKGGGGAGGSSGPNAATSAFQNLFKVVGKTLHDVPADFEKAAAAAAAARLRMANAQQSFHDASASLRSAFASAFADAQGVIGSLFGGPVISPTADDIKRRLGVRFASTSPASLTKDLNAQVHNATGFFNDLNRLKHRGAPQALINELQQAGLADAPEAHALAGASPAALKAFLKAFRARDQLAARVAIKSPQVRIAANAVTVAANKLDAAGGHATNVYVSIDGHPVTAVVTTRQQRTKRRSSSTRRGRHAGGKQ